MTPALASCPSVASDVAGREAGINRTFNREELTMTRHDEDSRVGGGGMQFSSRERAAFRLRARQDETRRIDREHARRLATSHGPREHGRPCPECEGAGGPCGWCYGTRRA